MKGGALFVLLFFSSLLSARLIMEYPAGTVMRQMGDRTVHISAIPISFLAPISICAPQLDLCDTGVKRECINTPICKMVSDCSIIDIRGKKGTCFEREVCASAVTCTEINETVCIPSPALCTETKVLKSFDMLYISDFAGASASDATPIEEITPIEEVGVLK